ncbi:MAG: hypothetical protein PHX62_01410 [Bacilli bacterium]|nr:hypothetical protein [Bacilli bacterium]
MKSEFGESQFMIGILIEILNGTKFGVKSGTKFKVPTLYDEKKSGWDTKIDKVKPIYVQFKVVEQMFDSRARNASVYGIPHFRFPLYTHTSSPPSQHNLLVDLSQDQTNLVYYCAPKFIESATYYKHYASSSLCDNSLFKKVLGMRKYHNTEYHDALFDDVKPFTVFSNEYIQYDDDYSFESFRNDILESVEFISLKQYIDKHRNLELSSNDKEVNLGSIVRHYVSHGIIPIFMYREEVELDNVK